jgi:hypothetical protein
VRTFSCEKGSTADARPAAAHLERDDRDEIAPVDLAGSCPGGRTRSTDSRSVSQLAMQEVLDVEADAHGQEP